MVGDPLAVRGVGRADQRHALYLQRLLPNVPDGLSEDLRDRHPAVGLPLNYGGEVSGADERAVRGAACGVRDLRLVGVAADGHDAVDHHLHGDHVPDGVTPHPAAHGPAAAAHAPLV